MNKRSNSSQGSSSDVSGEFRTYSEIDIESMSTISSESTVQISFSDCDDVVSHSGSELEDFGTKYPGNISDELQAVVTVYLYVDKFTGKRISVEIKKMQNGKPLEYYSSLDDVEIIELPPEQHEMTRLENSSIWSCKLHLDPEFVYQYVYIFDDKIINQNIISAPVLDADFAVNYFDLCTEIVALSEVYFREIWNSLMHEWVMVESNESLYHILRQYSELRLYVNKIWSKKNIHCTEANIHSIVVHGMVELIPKLRNTDRIIVVIALIGSQVKSKTFSHEILKSILYSLLSVQCRILSIKEELPELQYLDWIVDGMKRIQEMNLSKFLQYIWLASLHVIREIYTNPILLPPSEKDYLAACKELLAHGIFSPQTQEIMSSRFIVSSFVSQAPTFHSFVTIVGYIDGVPELFSNDLTTEFRAKLESFNQGMDTANDNLTDGFKLLKVIQNNDVLQTNLIFSTLFQSKLLLLVPDLGMGCLDLLNLKPSENYSTYQSFQGWVFKLVNNLNFSEFLSFINEIILKSNTFLYQRQEVFLNSIMSSYHFIESSPLDLFRNIVNSTEDEFSNVFQDFLYDRCKSIIDGQTNTSDYVNLLRSFSESSQITIFQGKLIEYLLSKLEFDPDLNSFFEIALWDEYLEIMKRSSHKILQDRYSYVKNFLEETLTFFEDMSLPLKHLLYILKNYGQFVQVLEICDLTFKMPDMFESVSTKVKWFNNSISFLRVYLSIFCYDADGDTKTKLERIVELRRIASEESFIVSLDLMSEMLNGYSLSDLEWLYHLRSTNLFLDLWNKHKRNNPQNVYTDVFPLVKKEWMDLYSKLDSDEITIGELTLYFEGIDAKRYRSELERLYTLRNVGEPLTVDDGWVNQRLHLLCQTSYLMHFQNQIPFILKLGIQLEEKFCVDLTEDTTFVAVQDFHRSISSSEYLKQRITTIQKYEHLFSLSSKLSITQMEFYSLLSKLDVLLKWLLKMNSNQEFMNLVDICKSASDDIKVLSSLTSLIEIRNLLRELILPECPFKSFKEFYQKLQSLVVTPTSVSHLKNLQSDFRRLVHVIEARTKSPGILALFQLQEIQRIGKYMITNEGIQLKASGELMSIGKLLDLRNKLILTEIPEKAIPKAKENVFLYVHQIPILEEIYVLRRYLKGQGHFDFQNCTPEVIPMDTSLDTLNKRLSDLKTRKKDWKIVVRDLRHQFYSLNLFTMEQAARLYELFLEKDDKKSFDEALQLVRLGNINCSSGELGLNLDEQWSPLDANTSEEKLWKVCSFLENMYQSSDYVNSFRSWKHSGSGLCHLTNELREKLENTKFWEKLKTHHFCVIAQDSFNMVLNTVVSIYAYYSRLPGPDEVCLCNYRTSIEELIIVINRWFYSPKIGREEGVFCIGNIDLLPYSTQARLLLHLNQLILSKENEKMASLVLISGNTNQMSDSRHILTVMGQFIVPFRPLKSENLKKIFDWTSNNVCQFQRVWSSVPGSGKTAHILQTAHHEGFSYRHYIFEKGSNEGNQEFISHLISISTPQPNLFHVEISPNLSHQDIVLFFELLYLGVSQCAGKIFYTRYSDSWMIEDMNTNGHPDFVFLQLLPQLEATVHQEILSFHRYHVCPSKTNSESKFKIVKEEDQPLSDCCKVLFCFEHNKLQSYFRNRVHNRPTNRNSLMLLRKYTKANNFLAFQRMAKVLHSYIKRLKDGNFFMKLTLNEIETLVQYAIDSASQFAVNYVDLLSSGRYEKMKKWEQIWKDHHYLMFSEVSTSENTLHLLGWKANEVQGKRKSKLQERKFLLKHFPYSPINAMEAHKLIQMIYEKPTRFVERFFYVNMSNLMMMLYITMMMKNNIPCILMADSGFGKTETLKFICSGLGISFARISLHGGHSSQDIVQWITPHLKRAVLDPTLELCIFLDQLNSANCMGFLKVLVSDRLVNDIKIPPNVKIVASCTPYRSSLLKSIEYQAQCSFYHVSDLPDTLNTYVVDYGEWNSEVEGKYILSLLDAAMKNVKEVPHINANHFTRLILYCHDYLRGKYAELSAVSLRDVKRMIQIWTWLQQSYENRGEGINEYTLKKTFLLALGHCYYYRLNHESRIEFESHIQQFGNGLMTEKFKEYLLEEQNYFTKQLKIPSGVALNASLRENIFMIMVSVLNRIPIFIIGKSGTSKSLAMDIVRNNLNGSASTNDFLRGMPNLEVFVYSCSRLSTGKGINETFHAARKFHRSASEDTITIVLLNEVGLLEQSEHFPIKVLYKELNREKPDIAIVGLSNFQFDVSIINRVIFLTKPPPLLEDLQVTLKSILSSQQLHSTLPVLAKAYEQVYKQQSSWNLRMDFFGLRDFYATIKFVNEGLEEFITPSLLSKAVMRNFGGVPDLMPKIIDQFFSNMGWDSSEAVYPESVLEPILDNLKDQNARNLMILTKDNAALQLLFDHLLCYEEVVLIFGDQRNSAQMLMNLLQVKNCMSEGKTVILINCQSLYESLYDLFNMSFTEYDGNRFVSLAMGTHSRQCLVHPNFRAILIVDKNEAMKTLAIPLLNRFEKQSLIPRDLIQSQDAIDLLKRLRVWESEFRSGKEIYQTFAGEHDNLLESLVVFLLQCYPDHDIDTNFAMGKDQLLWLATADAVVRTEKRYGTHYSTKYFDEQEHSSLPALIKRMEETGINHIQVLTYSPASMSIHDHYQEFQEVSFFMLHRLESPAALNQAISNFFEDREKKILIFQCDLSVVSQLKIQQTQLLCSKIEKEYGDRFKMVVFVIFMHPCQKPKFFVHFSPQWKSIFVDEISETTPTSKELMNHPLEYHLQQINLRQLILNNFRSSISSLNYGQSVSVTSKITILYKLLTHDTFWNEIEPIIKQVVQKYFSKSYERYWSEEVAHHIQNYLPLYGNYFRAVRSCLDLMVLKSFTKILSFLDSNGNLKVLLELIERNSTDFSVWMQLASLQNIPYDKSLETIQFSEVEVFKVSDHVFQSKFPFSYVVCPIIRQMRFLCRTARSGMARSLSTYLDLLWPKFQANARDYCIDYLYDYIHMFSMSHTSMKVHDQFRLAKLLMSHETINSISDVQAFIWKMDKKLNNYVAILEICPEKMVGEIMRKITVNDDNHPDQIFFETISELLGPSKLFSKQEETETFKRKVIDWMNSLSQLHDYTLTFVLCTNVSIRQERIKMWKVLHYFKHYLNDIILALPNSDIQKDANDFLVLLNSTDNTGTLFTLVYQYLQKLYFTRRSVEVSQCCHVFLRNFVTELFAEPQESAMPNIVSVLINLVRDDEQFCGQRLQPIVRKKILKAFVVRFSNAKYKSLWKNLLKALEFSLDRNLGLTTVPTNSLFYLLLTVYEEIFQGLSLLSLMKSISSIDCKSIFQRKEANLLIQQITILKVSMKKICQILHKNFYQHKLTTVELKFLEVFMTIIQKLPLKGRELIYRRIILFLIDQYGQCVATEILTSSLFVKLMPLRVNSKSLMKSVSFFLPYNAQVQETVKRFTRFVQLFVQKKETVPLERLYQRSLQKDALSQFQKALYLSVSVLVFKSEINELDFLRTWMQTRGLDQLDWVVGFFQAAPNYHNLFSDENSFVLRQSYAQSIVHLIGLSLLCEKKDFRLIWYALNDSQKLNERYLPGAECEDHENVEVYKVDKYDYQRGIHYGDQPNLYYSCRSMSPLATRICRLIMIGFITVERCLIGNVDGSNALSNQYRREWMHIVKMFNNHDEEATHFIHAMFQEFGKKISTNHDALFSFCKLNMKIPDHCLVFECEFNEWVQGLCYEFFDENIESFSSVAPVQYLFSPIVTNSDMKSVTNSDSAVWQSTISADFTRFHSFLFSQRNDTFPLLFELLENHEKIEISQKILEIREFYDILYAKYNCKIYMQFAKKCTIQDFLSSFENGKKKYVSQLFKNIQKVWNVIYGDPLMISTTLDKVLDGNLLRELIQIHNKLISLCVDEDHGQLPSRAINSETQLIHFTLAKMDDAIAEYIRVMPYNISKINAQIQVTFFRSKPILIEDEDQFIYLEDPDELSSSDVSSIYDISYLPSQVPLPENRKNLMMEELEEQSFNLEQMINELHQCYLFIQRGFISMEGSDLPRIMTIRYFAVEYLLFDEQKSELLKSVRISSQHIENIQAILQFLRLVHVPC